MLYTNMRNKRDRFVADGRFFENSRLVIALLSELNWIRFPKKYSFST